jgi:hypothetical protein
LRPYILAALFSFIHFALLLPTVDLCEVGGSSEAREVHVASIIRNTGEMILPLRNGAVPSKPPLYHWIAAAQAAARGAPVTPGAARVISVVSGAGMVWLTVLLALQFRAAAPAEGRAALRYTALAAWAALECLYEFPRISGEARVDALF